MKTKSLKAKIIGISILAAVAAATAVAIFVVGPIDVTAPQKKDPYEKWNQSGPFHINKFEYRIGDTIFISVDGLQTSDVGTMSFTMPDGTTTYIGIPFDGNVKTAFNQYFKPGISKSRGVCSVNDLIGEWTVTFEGTNNKPLKFKILNETIPGEGSYFERVC
jgi:hypothetical protein